MNSILFAATVCFGFFASAATIYVDDANYGKTGDGSLANPYGTIQEAVSAASTTAIDTIQVAAGTYGRDKTLISGSRYARVNINRVVKIVGAGQDKTFVVGSRDADDPVGGFYIAKGGYGSKIESLTVADCEVPGSEYGGGFGTAKSDDPTTNAYVVAYCTVTNCAASRGGGMRGGFAFSCKFLANNATSLGAGLYRASAYNTLVADSVSNYGVYDYGYLVNCTVMNNYGERGIQVSTGWRNAGYGRVWNTVTASNGKANNDADGIYTNCVSDASNATYYHADSKDVTLVFHGSNGNSTSKFSTNVVINAVGGDFAPVKGGFLDAKGVRDHFSLAFIPPEYQGRGFDGELWTGDVPIGALIPSKEAKTAPVILISAVKVFGKETPMNYSVIYSDIWPKQIYLEPRDKYAVMCTAFTMGNLASTRRYLGTKPGSWFLLPPKYEADNETLVSHQTINHAVASQLRWVDDDAVFEGEADGSEEKPYKTIQAAMDEIGAWGASTQTLVKVRAGYYTNGVTYSSDYKCYTRVNIPPSRDIQIVAVDGPEKTFVTGEPDPSTGGIGENSARCFASPNNTSLCIAGFTLMEGYTSTTDENGGAVRGGGSSQQVWDCVFTRNHAATTGACVNQAPVHRCLFTNNTDNTKGCIINAYGASCIFANNATSTHTYMPFQNSCGSYGCTIYEPETSSSCYIWNSNIHAFNTVVVAGGQTTQITSNKGVLAGNVIGNVKNYSGSFIDEQQLHTNPYVAFPAALDFRLTEISPALTAGRCVNAPAMTTASAVAFTAKDFVQYMIGDYEGNRQVMDDGSVRAGAVTTVRPKATVYADATNGNDENDGSTEALAKETLSAAIAVAAPGDTVTALPGDYRKGTDSLTVYDSSLKGNVVLTARVRVPDGVTLISSKGAEKTAIYGEKSPTGSTIPEFEGCGEGALRCAILEENATLSGFTLRCGRTPADTGDYKANYGAGALGRNRATSIVRDCILTDLIGSRGAGGAYVTFDHCVLTNNIAFTFASGGLFCSAYNTFFDDLRGSRMMEYYGEIVNCTIGRNVCNTNKTAVHTILNPYGDGPKIWNVLSLCDTSAYTMDMSGASVKNCVFPKAVINKYPADAENIITNRTRAELALDYDALGRANEVTANAVDAGYWTDLAGSTDLGGKARVLNRLIDIGCWETDWKDAYGAKLGQNVTVTSASAGVRATAEGAGVELTNGDTLELIWASGKLTGFSRLYYELGAGATLSVTINGVTTLLTGGTSFDFKSALASQSITLACTEGTTVTIGGFKRFNGFAYLLK